MIARPLYIKQLEPFIDKPQVKILTGIRRSGKSTILRLLQNRLVESGVASDQILVMNFESFAYADFKTAKSLYGYIKDKIQSEGKYYLLLDEIQEVEQWEKAINSFLVDFEVDIYLTGSNSHLLSSELSTFLAGRYVQIPVFTLSYKEYLDFKKEEFPELKNDKDGFEHYLRMGGFPVIHTQDYDAESAYKVVRDIYSSVILRDTVQRHNIRDIELLERVLRYAFDNVGNTFSGKNVADYFKSQQRKVDINTIYNYLTALESAFVLYRVSRYDIKGKEILKTMEKFYVGDLSLIYATMGYRSRMIGGLLENIVFLELKRRGYQVYIGKLGTKEIDFIAEKAGDKLYLQVAYKLEHKETVDREFQPLIAIRDHYPKYVITMDDFWDDNIQGIQHRYITDFLEANSW